MLEEFSMSLIENYQFVFGYFDHSITTLIINTATDEYDDDALLLPMMTTS